MELIKFLKIIKKNLVLIIILSIISSASTFAFYKIKPVSYLVFFEINVSQQGEDKTEDYKYDNYYSSQAVDIFTDSLEKWFQNPRIITEAYQKAGLDVASFDVKKRSKLIKARKTGPQYLEVSFKIPKKEQGEKIVAGLTSVLEGEVASLGKDKEVWFQINAGDPLIIEDKKEILSLLAISFIIGGILGVFISLIKDYLIFFRK
jgi:capsular polysaccharide biosynthesis protein